MLPAPIVGILVVDSVERGGVRLEGSLLVSMCVGDEMLVPHAGRSLDSTCLEPCVVAWSG